ncbi:4'-phosphopantetheinyl transferase family protein [Leifsonia aquatica]|uniref:4'-phosphopantetheinyl transferase family protein n=1 Tax=Leifsonia aquatica TaxID=144185 RepID=UPI0037F71566
MIPSGSALVLVANTARVLAALPDEPLAPEAAVRRDRLRATADRDDFTAARLLAAAAHRALSDEPFVAGRLVQRCDTCGGPHGRPQPSPAGLHLSWSHSHGVVAAAAAPGRLGVDVETGARRGDHPIATALSAAERRLLSESADPEAAFLLAWTVKETLVKAGAAELDAFAAMTVLVGDDRLVPRHGELSLDARRGDGYSAAAATRGPALWRTIDAAGGLAPLALRAVGGAA